LKVTVTTRRATQRHRSGSVSRRSGSCRRRVRLAALAALIFLVSAGSASAQALPANEYAVKAAFLFHFAQFVEWPEGAFREANSPLVYCTIGEDPFQGALDDSLKGKMIGAHPLQVRHLAEANEALGCHIAFVGKAAKKRVSEELATFYGSPVLTVGETEQFVKDRGMIGFCMEENKIRFDINLESAEKAKLKISARLLTLAKAVIGKPKRD
jgi:uncharacterized protein DUF4154